MKNSVSLVRFGSLLFLSFSLVWIPLSPARNSLFFEHFPFFSRSFSASPGIKILGFWEGQRYGSRMERFERFRFSVLTVPPRKAPLCISVQVEGMARFRFRCQSLKNGSDDSGSDYSFWKRVPTSGFRFWFCFCAILELEIEIGNSFWINFPFCIGVLLCMCCSDYYQDADTEFVGELMNVVTQIHIQIFILWELIPYVLMRGYRSHPGPLGPKSRKSRRKVPRTSWPRGRKKL